MQKFIDAVEKNGQLAKDALDYLWKNPETGYREWKAHAYLTKAFRDLGYELVEAGNIPGFYVDVDTGRPGPLVLVMGELDSLVCESHPDADPETGAVHACGHCCQAAGLLGVAAALKEPGVLDGWCGKIRLMATPAEELIEVEYRQQLRKEGKIRYFGGKQEFLYRGLLDGVDMAFMQHTTPYPVAYIDRFWNGCISKNICYKGVSAHAGGAPHLGVNALYAANLGLNAINALRETFQDQAHIRVHPIITAGGDAVNAVPDTVRLESYVRGATVEDIMQVNRKVNRALAATAAAMGGNVQLLDTPGYMPETDDPMFMALCGEAMEAVMGKVHVKYEGFTTGCTDMGDISCVMPTVQMHIPGASGKGHGIDFKIADPEKACVQAAQIQLITLVKLLSNEAKRAKEILSQHTPLFATKQDYFETMDKLFLDVEAVEYAEDGSVKLTFK